MKQGVLDILEQSSKNLAILIDPEKTNTEDQLKPLLSLISKLEPEFIFVGGSTVSQQQMKDCLQVIKKYSSIPTVIFPGSAEQVDEQADALLFLSLLSGRNPDYLIGHQVRSARQLKKMDIETISTAYLLVDGGKTSSVSYVSQTSPIPNEQIGIAVNTAVAGEMLGFKAVFMDAGSGAINAVPTEMIRAVKSEIDIPLIIGGGIKTIEEMDAVYEAGADVVVIGNKIEKDVDFMLDLISYFKSEKVK